MQCIHPTTQSGRAFSALATDGLAPDDAVERLAEVVGYRLHISLGEVSCQCGDPSTLTLVALDPDDPSLPAAARSSLADLRPGTAIAAAELTELVGRIGENLVLRRAQRLAVGKGLVASYVHNSLAPGIGKIGVLVALESEAGGEAVETLGRQLAMHVAAANPLYLDTAAVPGSALDRERAVLREQAQGSGKTEAIVDRMVEGRLRKFYEEVVLLEQVFVVDGESRVGKVVEAAAKAAGKPIRVAGFARFALGEGVERPPSDFAAEVGAQLKR